MEIQTNGFIVFYNFIHLHYTNHNKNFKKKEKNNYFLI